MNSGTQAEQNQESGVQDPTLNQTHVEQTQANPFQSQNLLSNPEIARLVEQARHEEKTKLYSNISKSKESQKLLETELKQIKAEYEAANKRLKEQESAQLPSDEKLRKQIADMEMQFAQTQQQLLEQVSHLTQQTRKHQLDAYKEKRLKEEAANGPLFHDQVFGNNEEEIEHSIRQSRETYMTLQKEFYSQFLRQQEAERMAKMQAEQQQPQNYQIGVPQTHSMTTTLNPNLIRNGFAPIIPNKGQASSYYQSPMQGNMISNSQNIPTQNQGGFPSAPASSGPSVGVTQNQMKNLASEEAIRSGDYAKHRNQLLESIRQKL